MLRKRDGLLIGNRVLFGRDDVGVDQFDAANQLRQHSPRRHFITAACRHSLPTPVRVSVSSGEPRRRDRHSLLSVFAEMTGAVRCLPLPLRQRAQRFPLTVTISAPVGSGLVNIAL